MAREFNIAKKNRSKEYFDHNVFKPRIEGPGSFKCQKTAVLQSLHKSLKRKLQFPVLPDRPAKVDQLISGIIYKLES